jgi:hypothetical protein
VNAYADAPWRRPVAQRTGLWPKLLKTKGMTPLDTPVYGGYTGFMGTPADKTTVRSFRIFKAQDAAMNRIAGSISGSALVRALLSLYFSGRVPEAYGLAIKEAKRAEAAIRAPSKPQQQNSNNEMVA